MVQFFSDFDISDLEFENMRGFLAFLFFFSLQLSHSSNCLVFILNEQYRFY